MKDLEIELENKPGSLALFGEALASAGVSIEGGGAWICGSTGTAHFLVKDANAACDVLKKAGIMVRKVNNVLTQRLKQDQPGQLGKLTRLMANAGVNIEVLYSDHDHQLILVVDDYDKGKLVSDSWIEGL